MEELVENRQDPEATNMHKHGLMDMDIDRAHVMADVGFGLVDCGIVIGVLMPFGSKEHSNLEPCYVIIIEYTV